MTFAQSAFAYARPLWRKLADRATHRSAGLAEFTRVRAVTQVRDAVAEVAPGAIGTIVHVHDNGKAFEVEFHAPTHAVLLAERDQIEAA